MKIKSYYASTELLCEKFDVYINRLPENLKERILKMTDINAKVCSLGGALLLKIASKEFGTDPEMVVYAENGKPYIPDSDFHFSISHTKGYAAISFGKVPSGCDIQIEKAVNLKISERFFSEKEKLTVADNLMEFFNVWCRKESLYKLSGTNCCTVDNKEKYVFKDFILKDDLHFCVCAETGEVLKPQLIDFDTAF